MLRRACFVSAAVTLWGSAVAAAPLGTPAATGDTHVEWLRQDHTFNVGGALVRANGDAVPDVVTFSAHRGGYQQCFTGAPTAAAHLALDTVHAPSVKLSVLNGTNGTPLWERSFDDGGLVGVRLTPTYFHLSSSVHTGDFDADGLDDLLLLRTTRSADGSELKLHRTLYDPATGTVRWTVERSVEAGGVVLQGFTPMHVFGEPGGLLMDMVITIELEGTFVRITIDGESSFVRMRPGALPETIVTLPEDMATTIPVAYGSGYRLLSFPTTIEGTPPNLQLISSVEAVDLALDEQGDPVFADAWSRPGAGGSHFSVSGGSNPAVIVTRPTADLHGFLAAMDLDDGTDRWTNPLDVGPRGGTFALADANGDGVQDVIASPAFGAEPPDPANVLAGGFFAEIHALDGRTGQAMYTHTERLAKYRAWSLAFGDIEGDGKREILAGLAQQDGFPGCSQPSDDIGAVGVYELSTGVAECRLTTDRFPTALLAAKLNTTPGDEVVAPTVGGNVWAFKRSQPGCGAMAADPVIP